MSKHEMMGGWDPYDAMVQMDLRLQQVTQAHNQMAQDFYKLQAEFTTLLISHNNLQKSHLAMNEILANKLYADLNKQLTTGSS